MKKIIALVGISLSCVLVAPSAYASCSNLQQQACNDANTERTNICNFNGAGQSCYNDSICQYYACMEACGDGSLPQGCGNQ
ncbi:MAG: hypothetical protein QOF89_4739 [Acidobacteriota bacterium]|jgi:hypothetical protein|nr:hypothetical protein [Acidobacteriota bacterium]